jgi:hypothetical protein
MKKRDIWYDDEELLIVQLIFIWKKINLLSITLDDDLREIVGEKNSRWFFYPTIFFFKLKKKKLITLAVRKEVF